MRGTAHSVTLTRNAPLFRAPSPGISVSRVEPSGAFFSRFCQSSSRSLGRCLLLGQRSRMNLFSYLIGSLFHQHTEILTVSLRATATMATLEATSRGCLRQTERKNSLSSLSCRIADQEAWMSLLLSRSSPVRVIDPRSTLSPVECSVGTKPKNPAS